MTLSSTIFVFGFLPIFLLIYFISRKDFIRNIVLLAGSIYFYYITEVYRIRYILILCVTIYLLTWLMDKLDGHYDRLRKLFAFTGISASVLLLFYYRYLNFTVSILGTIFRADYIWQKGNYGAPLGLSFLTFSIVSYVADCYTRKIQVQKNPFLFATYIFMFPKIIMGPIERYHELEGELKHPDVSIDNIGDGIKRFMIGFCKKLIIADNLALLVNQIEVGTDFSQTPITILWLGSIGFSLQLFFDFSGYSDMAIGIAQMLGFHFKENFNYPYCASSITDFWRRWHISLSSWFKDYVYIPLGGSRCSVIRNIFNLFVVWVLTGLWHGAAYNFILWGLIYFAFLLLERYIIKPVKRGKSLRILWRIVSLLIINFNWVFFHLPSWKTGISYCLAMLGLSGNPFSDILLIKYIRDYGIYLLFGILFSMPVVPWLSKNIKEKDCYGISSLIYPILIAAAFIWALSFVMLGAHNPFLYQQF